MISRQIANGARIHLRVCAFLAALMTAAALPARSDTDYIPVLAGSSLVLEELVADPDVVVAKAELESVGNPTMLGGPGQYTYTDVKFNVTKLLKGNAAKTVLLYFSISYSAKEEDLLEGTQYIVFIYPPSVTNVQWLDGPKHTNIRCLKILPADPQTVAKVASAISAAR